MNAKVTFLFGACDCTVDSDVGTGDISHVSPDMDCNV